MGNYSLKSPDKMCTQRVGLAARKPLLPAFLARINVKKNVQRSGIIGYENLHVRHYFS